MQVFGCDAVDAGDVAAALRDVGVIVDSRCSSTPNTHSSSRVAVTVVEQGRAGSAAVASAAQQRRRRWR